MITIIVQMQYDNYRSNENFDQNAISRCTTTSFNNIGDVQKQQHNNVEIVAALSPCKKIFYSSYVDDGSIHP